MWKLPAAFVLGIGVALATLWLYQSSVLGQTSSYTVPRTPDGKPDLNGIWQARTARIGTFRITRARQGPVSLSGPHSACPAGRASSRAARHPLPAVGGSAARRRTRTWLTRDPEIKCFLPGVPRATYMPYPFQIVQTPAHVLIAYEFAGASRTIFMGSITRREHRIDSLDGLVARPLGRATRWSSTSQASTARRGSIAPAIFTATALHVVERYTPHRPESSAVRSHDRRSEGVYAALEDEHAALSAGRTERAALEYKCVEFAEEVMYGHLRKGAQ